jgi:hypothetical protein
VLSSASPYEKTERKIYFLKMMMKRPLYKPHLHSHDITEEYFVLRTAAGAGTNGDKRILERRRKKRKKN